MRGPARIAVRLAAAFLAAACLVLTGCSDGAPTPTVSEAAVCGGPQSVIDELYAPQSDPLAVMDALNELQPAILEADNPELAAAGTSLYEAILPTVAEATDVPDYSQLTLEETQELANEVYAEADAALVGLLNECGEVGAPLDGLPEGTGR